MKPIKIITLILMAALMAACSDDAEPDTGTWSALNITTRAAGQGQTYTAGHITLVVDAGGTEYTLYYTYNNNSEKWEHCDAIGNIIATAPNLPLINGKSYPAYAYGGLVVAYGTSVEPIYSSWAGNFTPVVAAGQATADFEFTPVTSRFRVTLKGSYGEADEAMPDFYITPQFKAYELGAGGQPLWNIPTDPYTIPRTLQTCNYMQYYLYNTTSGLSYSHYPAGQTIAAGEPLFKIEVHSPAGTTPYDGKTYTIAAPEAFTLAAGHQYNYTLRITGGGQATIEDSSVSIIGFNEQPATGVEGYPGSTRKGISTETELRQFIADYNTDYTSAYAKWADTDARAILLLADIDIATGAEALPPVFHLHHVFDGLGHTISGAVINEMDSYNYCGFIAYNRGTVRRLNLRNAKVGSTAVERAGGICGVNDGTVIACSFGGTVTSNSSYCAGGICGQNFRNIAGCYSIATEITGGVRGAICGYNSLMSFIFGCIWKAETGLPTDAAGLCDTIAFIDATTTSIPATAAWTATQITAMNDGIEYINAYESSPCPSRWVLFPDMDEPQIRE